MAEKNGRIGDGDPSSNFGLKLNVHVQYNINIACSHPLTCLKIEVNYLLK